MGKDVIGRDHRRLGQALERLLIAFVCLDPRLMAAYPVTRSEVADDRGNRQPAVAADGGDSIGDRRRVVAGVLA